MKVTVKKSFAFSDNGYEVKIIREGKQELPERLGKHALLMGYADDPNATGEKGGEPDASEKSAGRNSSGKRAGKSQ